MAKKLSKRETKILEEWGQAWNTEDGDDVVVLDKRRSERVDIKGTCLTVTVIRPAPKPN